jgi:cytidyltransferase-like protein
MDTVVIYPGRFHPFHKGHKSVYDALVKRFGKNRVYIATSNKVDPPKSPFTFDEKRAMMALTGVDPSRVVQVKNPYQATEITDNYDPQNTIALFAVSDKDMAEDPRFSFKPKKDGQPSYYQPASKDMQGFDKHGYIITVPTLQFNVLGKPMRSASEFRANFARADSETQRAMITDLFGQYDPKTHNTMAQKIVEQLVRADEILDKLIEMGANDKYIVEACARVDMLKNQVLTENRRQSLYQAIMEGGHTLPENEIVREANYSKWDHKEPVLYAQFLAQTFGEPDEHTNEQCVWHNKDGFKRIVVRDEYILHGSPAPHYDFVYCYIDLDVDENLSDELANCSGSILIDHLKNEVGARCGSLTANATTLNFVLDVTAGRTEPTKEEYEKRILGMSDKFERGIKTTYDWWSDEANDADPENPYYAESVSEEITDFNKEDPMNSVIAIRGIGTMSISSALKEVSEMAANVSNLAKVKHAKGIQDNFDRYMGLLATYNDGIQEAYSELAAQRKRGGTASRGIDKDIQEGSYDDSVGAQQVMKRILGNAEAMLKAGASASEVQNYVNGKASTFSKAGVKVPDMRRSVINIVGEALSDEEMDAFHVELDKLVHKYFGHSSDEKKMDEGNDLVPVKPKDTSDKLSVLEPSASLADVEKAFIILLRQRELEKALRKNNEAKEIDEHCGDPMAHEHEPGRTLLMKLYKKEMQCQPGSPEHFEVMRMIDGCRKNIGLEENVFTDVVNKVAGDFKKRKKLFGKGKA